MENRIIVIQYIGDAPTTEIKAAMVAAMSSIIWNNDNIHVTDLSSKDIACVVGKTATMCNPQPELSQLEQALVYINVQCANATTAQDFAVALAHSAMIELQSGNPRLRSAIEIVATEGDQHYEILRKHKITKTMLDAIKSVHTKLY